MGRLRGNRPPRELTTERQGRAWSLAQEGWTQERIAAELDVSQSTVSDLLSKLNDAYLKRNLDKVERVKVQQTRTLLWMADEALQAWRKSKEPGRRARTGDSGEVLETYEREGDIRYLHTARACMADIRSIWGADVAPAQQDAALGIAQLIADLETRGRAYETRPDSEGPADSGSVPPGTEPGATQVQDGPGPVQ